MENRQPANQLDHPALQLIAARPDIFHRRGHVAATYRYRDGKRFGPYYRLTYRLDGRQCSVYLGRSPALADQVRQALSAIQKPWAMRRLMGQLERQVRASLHVQRRRTDELLRPHGLHLKGYEVRGWRHSLLRKLIPRRISLGQVARLSAPRRARRGPTMVSTVRRNSERLHAAGGVRGEARQAVPPRRTRATE